MSQHSGGAIQQYFRCDWCGRTLVDDARDCPEDWFFAALGQGNHLESAAVSGEVYHFCSSDCRQTWMKDGIK